MLVLRKDQREWERADSRADIAENGVRDLPAVRPEIDGAHLASASDDRIRKIDLAIELECSCLHGKCTRSRPRLRGLVDDANSHAQTG